MGRLLIVAGVLAMLSCVPPPQDAKPPPSAPPDEPEEVRVHIDGPPDSRLELVMPEERQVCEAPCDVAVSASRQHRYRVSGTPIFPSKPFFLRRNDQGYSVVTVRGSPFLYYLGFAALLAGLGTITLGLADVALPRDEPQPTQTEGAILLLVGAAVTVTGALLMGDNQETSVKGDVLMGLLSPQRSAHLPSWSGPMDRTPVPPVQSIHLYTLAF